MAFGNRFVVILSCCVLVAGCGNRAVVAPVSERGVRPVSAAAPGAAATPRKVARQSRYHRVKRGQTLYSIAWQYGRDYREVARLNKIGPPYTIHPGQRLRIAPAAGRKASGPAPAKDTRIAVTRVTKAAPKPAPANNRPLRWTWPAKGKIRKTYALSGVGKKGIDIGGRSGDPVRAAADGTVVYSGSGLVGYGRLIIVKHDGEFLSAYAHNEKLMVKEGDTVRGGQIIARMGDSGTDATMLHFEIRRSGEPVDPMRYLPRRR